MTTTHASALSARTVSALVRRAIGTGNAACHSRTSGAVLVVVTGNADRSQDCEVLARAVVAAALQAGYDAARTGAVVTIAVPEPIGDGEVVPATVVEQDAPRQTPDGEFRHEPTCTPDPGACTCTPRYWTPEEVAADALRTEADAALDASHVAEARGDKQEGTRLVMRATDLRAQADLLDGPAGCDCDAVPGPHAVHCSDCSAPADRCVCDEPGPEVDDPREEPRPLEWSEVAHP